MSHCAVWRRSYHLRGRYTKRRWDVSQTPFYVPAGRGRYAGKGTTSVEECVAAAVVAARGEISRENDEPEDPARHRRGVGADADAGRVVFGAVKFHARII